MKPPESSTGADSLVDGMQPEQIVSELEGALERASRLLRLLQERVPAAPPDGAHDAAHEQVQSLRQRLEAAETDLTELSEQLVDTEHQRGRLMNLYVATYQLHATLDLEEVKATIAEIARELLGAERFVLLLREEGGNSCEIALAEGPRGEEGGLFAGERYRGGDPLVDRTLDDGTLRTSQAAGSEALAVVPLKVQGTVVGAVVLLKLYDHKPSLTPDDRDLLDLLAAHAASALFAARVYSNTDRKLRTLESLVKLVRS